jgi:prepilin-type N-terminal cleavage/methylation domain-containing protein
MTVAASRLTGEKGFSLVETLIATTIMTVALAALAQLFALSTRNNQSARSTTFAATLAQQKMEQLRSLTWGFDILGLPITDLTTDIADVPPSETDGKGLSPSPTDSLRKNYAGYCDFLDEHGQSLGTDDEPPPGTMYIRRWSIEPLPANPNNTIVLQVMVTVRRNRGGADGTLGTDRRLPDEARIVSVKTRKAA